VLLSQIQVAGGGQLDGLTLRLDDPSGAPRRLNLLFGGEGVGKTALLAAIASTRPGHAVVQTPASRSEDAPLVATQWILGDDDPMRPHPLRVVSPNARLPGEREDAALLRRREQALFDRRASEGGFVVVAFSGARWFSRSTIVLTSPERGVLRHDQRASASFDDATRADLAREVKGTLSFSAVSAALAGPVPAPEHLRFCAFDRAVREALEVLLEGTGAAYLGTSPRTLEPLFALEHRTIDFDDLPRSLRHRVAFGAITVRALAAAYPHKNPRTAEGVVLLDDLEVQQDTRLVAALPALLSRALPRVQWIVTTASPQVAAACDATEVIALRREPGSDRVALHQGPEAIVH
jgi:hypothetical protein